MKHLTGAIAIEPMVSFVRKEEGVAGARTRARVEVRRAMEENIVDVREVRVWDLGVRRVAEEERRKECRVRGRLRRGETEVNMGRCIEEERRRGV